ncbi:DNA-directed RNA polymerase III subunit [Nymphaea thermarum]|nr:DNA-directed RNA polymerase III subunit [Nymphaea thermarum]
MFFLNVLEHTLQLPPDRHGRPLDQVLTEELEKLFVDKVIKDLGLCVSIYGLKSIAGGFILPGEGASTYTVVLGVVMFRPFVGEVIVGKIKSSDSTGLCCKNDDDLWVWALEVDGETVDLVLQPGEEVRFRVTGVKYPPIPIEQEKDAKPFSPMLISVKVGSMMLMSYREEVPLDWFKQALRNLDLVPCPGGKMESNQGLRSEFSICQLNYLSRFEGLTRIIDMLM